MATFKHIALACAITAGLVALLAYLLRAPTAPLNVAHSTPAPKITPPTPKPTSRAESTDPTAVVEALRAACVEEVKRGGEPGASGSACRQYERMTAGIGDPTINTMESIAPIPDAPRSQRRRSVQPDLSHGTVTPLSCDWFGYGSIRYRQCRADEKQRLIEICRREKEQAENARGDRHQALAALARENCRIADLYRIVN